MKHCMEYANENIKLLLRFKKWTQEKLSNKTGINPITMKRRLNSKIPTWTMIEAVAVAEALEAPFEELFFTHMSPIGNEKNSA